MSNSHGNTSNTLTFYDILIGWWSKWLLEDHWPKTYWSNMLTSTKGSFGPSSITVHYGMWTLWPFSKLDKKQTNKQRKGHFLHNPNSEKLSILTVVNLAFRSCETMVTFTLITRYLRNDTAWSTIMTISLWTIWKKNQFRVSLYWISFITKWNKRFLVDMFRWQCFNPDRSQSNKIQQWEAKKMC